MLSGTGEAPEVAEVDPISEFYQVSVTVLPPVQTFTSPVSVQLTYSIRVVSHFTELTFQVTGQFGLDGDHLLELAAALVASARVRRRRKQIQLQ